MSLLATCLVLSLATQSARCAAESPRPNLVYILCDDLGYGDVGAFNPQGKIATPHFDRLASEGMRFTDMHSGSAVCTPTRYGIMTGRYAWRTRLARGVLGGLSPHLIADNRLTVGKLLQQHGYHTACIGKWHLGVDWTIRPGSTVSEFSVETPDQVNSVDYSLPFAQGPTARGFDHFFGISASLDMVPYTYLEGDRVRVLPTVQRDFPMVLGQERRTRFGPAAPEFAVDQVLPTLTSEGAQYIRSRAESARGGQPFFLYLPLASPHTPVVPTDEWQGKSRVSMYADFVQQTDASIGAILAVLDECGLAENTLVMVTSDNGFAPAADLDAQLAAGHHPSYVFRGAKADIFEGGHRIPFVARWPSTVPAATVCEDLFCLTDLLATVAEILDDELPADSGEDSFSMTPAWNQHSRSARRTSAVHHSANGTFAIRHRDWKLIFAPDSGGWSDPRPGDKQAQALPARQLYNLRADIGETTNLIAEFPEKEAELTSLMQQLVDQGRSTAGPAQANDREVVFGAPLQ